MNVWLQLAIGIVALYFVLRLVLGDLVLGSPPGRLKVLDRRTFGSLGGHAIAKKTPAEESIRRDIIDAARRGGTIFLAIYKILS
jgi:hypothetical protein